MVEQIRKGQYNFISRGDSKVLGQTKKKIDNATERYPEVIKQPLSNVKSDYLSVLERYTQNNFSAYSKAVK